MSLDVFGGLGGYLYGLHVIVGGLSNVTEGLNPDMSDLYQYQCVRVLLVTEPYITAVIRFRRV